MEIDTILPEDAIPEDLNFQYMTERTDKESLSKEDFCEWLHEGKFEQDVAGLLINLWVYTISTHPSAALADFYEELLSTFIQEEDYASTYNTEQLLLRDLARFIRMKCKLSFHVESEVPEDIGNIISDQN